jgi:hypothetical protein
VVAQVLHDGFEYAGVVVDGEEDRLRHRLLMRTQGGWGESGRRAM